MKRFGVESGGCFGRATKVSCMKTVVVVSGSYVGKTSNILCIKPFVIIGGNSEEGQTVSRIEPFIVIANGCSKELQRFHA